MRVRTLILLLVVCIAIPTLASAQTSGGKLVPLPEVSAKNNGGNITINFSGFKNPAEAITAYSFGVSVAVSSGGTGGGTGKVNFQDLSFIKPVTPLSQELFLNCATGKHIPDVTITVTTGNAKGQQKQFLEIKLTDVLVSSYSSSGGGDTPQDSVTLNFQSMTYTVF